MKKITLTIFALITIISCCPNDGELQIITIETARPLLFSFDENGIFPHLDEFNPNELGIGVYQDSITTRIEMPEGCSGGRNDQMYTNTIDSLNVRTLFDFDDNHLAGSNVNDILFFLDNLGETFEVPVNSTSSIISNFKFSVVPQNDSLQFEVTGRITDKGPFIERTELVILE